MGVLSVLGTDSGHAGAKIGGTVIAVVVAVFVLVAVSIVGGTLFAYIQYYMSSMRAEAAIFLGILFGGFVGTFAARYACDAVIKSYSGKAVFIVFMLIGAGAFALELNKGLDWQSVGRLGQWVVIAWASWGLFWKEEAV